MHAHPSRQQSRLVASTVHVSRCRSLFGWLSRLERAARRMCDIKPLLGLHLNPPSQGAYACMFADIIGSSHLQQHTRTQLGAAEHMHAKLCVSTKLVAACVRWKVMGTPPVDWLVRFWRSSVGLLFQNEVCKLEAAKCMRLGVGCIRFGVLKTWKQPAGGT